MHAIIIIATYIVYNYNLTTNAIKKLITMHRHNYID